MTVTDFSGDHQMSIRFVLLNYWVQVPHNIDHGSDPDHVVKIYQTTQITPVVVLDFFDHNVHRI